MKNHAKVLGLAIVAVLALSAFVGVGSAAANAKVCSTSGTGEACGGSHGKIYTGPIKASLIATTNTTEVHAVLQSTFTSVTCGASSVEGEVTNGATGTGKITKLTFSKCGTSAGAENCTADTNAATAPNWAATGTASGKSDGNGSMDVSNVTGHFDCIIFGGHVNCYYKKASANVDVFGSDITPTIEATAVALEKEEPSSSLCSSTATWTARYSIETPTTLFLT